MLPSALVVDQPLQRTVITTAELAEPGGAARLYLSSLAASGARTQRSALDQMAAMLDERLRCTPGAHLRVPWHELRYAHSQALRARLAAAYQPRTTNRMLAALRGVLRAAWRAGLMTAEDYHAASDVRPAEMGTAPAGRAPEGAEVERLLVAARGHAGLAGLRDPALVAVLYGAGLRRAEALGLAVTDWDDGSGALNVLGKRGKRRLAYLAPAYVPDLSAWTSRLPAEGPLFPRLHRSDQPTSHPLALSAVNRLLSQLVVEAGLERLTPHDLRRAFGTQLLDAGVDLSTVSKCMGHAQLSTTAIYDRRGEKAKKEAVTHLGEKPTS